MVDIRLSIVKVKFPGLLAEGRAMATGRATEAEEKMVRLPLGDRRFYMRAPLFRLSGSHLGDLG